MSKVHVIGGGLAGCEAAWQIAERGQKVWLYEMRPGQSSPAHHTEGLAELVCSNSLRAAGLENAAGLLKEEMRRLHSLIMQAADATKVPAGGALAVDRQGFSDYVTRKIEEHPLITLQREEVSELPSEGITIVASGPLTSPALSAQLAHLTGQEYLYFYDAAAPVVTADSLDFDKIFLASRYDKGTADYLNCPLQKEEYEQFWQELVAAETVPLKDFEKLCIFEGCMPLEIMAARGIDTLRFGPLKPIGLKDPRTGREAYAVVQLRRDNAEASLYNLVGFQTHLKWGEQKRVFGLIPGLQQADFVRYGVMHRNTYINAPRLLQTTLQLRGKGAILFAGQLSGVEGYIESAASGLVAGINAARLAQGNAAVSLPADTACGALCQYISSSAAKHFQPMNINFGLLPPLAERVKDKRRKNALISERALNSLQGFINCNL